MEFWSEMGLQLCCRPSVASSVFKSCCRAFSLANPMWPPLCTTAGTADWSGETGSPAHLLSGVALRTSLTTLLSYHTDVKFTD